MIINSFSKYFCMTGWRVGWMVAPDALVRPIERLQQNLAISVPTLSQVAAAAAFDGRDEMEAVKHGYEENRRILVEGLPKAGLDKFLPVDGAFYLYADVSRFTDDSFDFAKRMLEEAGVAATPGIDFDPVRRQALRPLLLRRFRRRHARGGGPHRALVASLKFAGKLWRRQLRKRVLRAKSIILTSALARRRATSALVAAVTRNGANRNVERPQGLQHAGPSRPCRTEAKKALLERFKTAAGTRRQGI